MRTFLGKGELSYRLVDIIIYSICMIKIIVKLFLIQCCIPILFVLHPILSPYSSWSVCESFTNEVVTHITLHHDI